jgi:hypothetical protein
LFSLIQVQLIGSGLQAIMFTFHTDHAQKQTKRAGFM